MTPSAFLSEYYQAIRSPSPQVFLLEQRNNAAPRLHIKQLQPEEVVVTWMSRCRRPTDIISLRCDPRTGAIAEASLIDAIVAQVGAVIVEVTPTRKQVIA